MKLSSSHKLDIFHTYSFKMFIMFSTISLVSIMVITNIILGAVSDKMIEQEKKINSRIVEITAEYMDAKIESASKTIQDIYYSDVEMQEIINFMLNEDWDDSIVIDNLSKMQRFEKHFISALYNDSDIVDISLVSDNGMKAYIFSKKWSTVVVEDTPFVYPWALDIARNHQSLTTIPTYPSQHDDGAGQYIYSVATTLFTTNSNSGSMGTFIINFDTGSIEEAYSTYDSDLKGEVMVFDQDGQVVYDSAGVYYEKTFLDYDSLIHVQNDFTEHGDFVSVGKTQNADYSVVIMTPKSRLYEDVDTLRFQVVVVSLLVVMMLLIAFYYTSSFLVKRIEGITAAMSRAQQGDLSVRIPTGAARRDELHKIARMFNNMCEELDGHIKRTYLFELKLKETELVALQSQINPHFLYNTLEVIRVKALMNRNHDISEMIGLLSNLFRRSLRSKDIVISIKDELDYARDYLELNQIRFMDRMRIDYKIDEGLYQMGTMKSVLQPLIENVIVHSVDGSSQLVEISIAGYLSEEDVILKVTDTGKGISEDRLKEINRQLNEGIGSISSQHIGLKNVSDRLKIVFGIDYGLQVYSVEDQWTEIRLRFPAVETEEMQKMIQTVFAK